MRAYNVEVLKGDADRASADCHGWCFGLPPGIKPAQWPLNPSNGYPLMHGFTILLPEEYRVHGPDIVALSFFATPPDHNDGMPLEIPEIALALSNPDQDAPTDPKLRFYWEAERRRHPLMRRMTDNLDLSYAVILLTKGEFDGALCEPPALPNCEYLSQIPAPAWMESGSAASSRQDGPAWLFDQGEHLVMSSNRAVNWTARKEDPNAGIPPAGHKSVPYDGAQQTSGSADGAPQYRSKYYRDATGNLEVHSWADDHRIPHIGGTMSPSQAMPGFSPFYIEFGEEFGGYNFGGDGIAQLDFKEMRFDWACG